MRIYTCGRVLFGWWLLCTPLWASSAPLEPARIEAYLKTLVEVRQFGERLQAEGKGDFIVREITPRAGESFDPHRRAVEALRREQPADYAALAQRLHRYQFTSPNSWALLGDRVVLAYGAVKVESESPEVLLLAQQMQGVDPAMLQLLPPQSRVEVEQALLIAQALARVPTQDKQTVRPYIARLDRAFSH